MFVPKLARPRPPIAATVPEVVMIPIGRPGTKENSGPRSVSGRLSETCTVRLKATRKELSTVGERMLFT